VVVSFRADVLPGFPAVLSQITFTPPYIYGPSSFFITIPHQNPCLQKSKALIGGYSSRMKYLEFPNVSTAGSYPARYSISIHKLIQWLEMSAASGLC